MRASATIVIPAWNEWELTRSCLETLRPTLGVRDRVVVVDNGSVDGTSEGLRRFPWVRVVQHAENTGFAAGCNSGAAGATGDVVVFLNNDTLLPSRWLDGLLRPFEDPSVAATGPRSNFVSGPQLVPHVPYSADRTADVQRFARTWRQEHRGQTSETERLVGFCLAVRREAFESLGGFDEGFGLGGAEDDDLCLRLVDAGHRLLITHESFVHHHGHRTFEANGVPWHALQEQNLQRLAAKRGGRRRAADAATVLLSACMIVKDEEENLPDCLSALDGLVDEVVVYDTGSTDATVEIARRAGAKVIEGYWDDDFSRARNAALAGCTGAWVLHVDADEVAQGDLQLVRRELRSTTADALTVLIGNLDDDGQVEVWHTPTRLFRRTLGQWAGRIHEQVVSCDGRQLTRLRSHLELRHSGYTTQAMTGRGKPQRNLRLAQLAAEEHADAETLINLAKSLNVSGRSAEALEHVDRAGEVATTVALQRLALRHGVQLLLDAGRPAEALARLARLRPLTTSTAVPDYLEGLARFALGEPEAALACLNRIEPGAALADEEYALPHYLVPLRRGLALHLRGRWDEAAADLLTAAEQGGRSHALWVPLLESHHRAGLPLDPVVALDDSTKRVMLFGHALSADVGTAQALALHLWASDPDRLAVLAFVSRLVERLALPQVVEWSVRVREAGLAEHCPLAMWAASPRLPALQRLQAAAMLSAAADARVDQLLPAVSRDVADSEIAAALLVLDELSPSLLPAFVGILADDPRRRGATADALEALGAQEQAAALRATAA